MTELPGLPTDSYRPRLTQSLGFVDLAGWVVKIIGISADDELLNEEEVVAAVACAERQLPQPPVADGRCGIAFVIVHRGTAALWVIVAWWCADILYQRLFRADLGSTVPRPVPPDGPTACVWELSAIDHERRAWVTHVLARPTSPDLDGYLASSVGSPVPEP